MYLKDIHHVHHNGRLYVLLEMDISREGEKLRGIEVHKGEKWHAMQVYDAGERVYELLFPYDMTVKECKDYIKEYCEKD